MFTTIGWYTKDTEYEKVMKEYLVPSVMKLNLPHVIYPVDSIGTWAQNTNLKSRVIEQAFDEVDTDLLIVDADAIIHSYPKLLEEIPEEYDCAMFWLDWNEWYQNGSNVKELCSGTLYLRNRGICKELVERWVKIGATNNVTDQKALAMTLPEFPDLKIYNLPYEYCWIHNLPGGRETIVPRPDKIVIEHFQASRDIKRFIK